MNVEFQNTLALILQQLADFFGMSVETITANAPEWLAKYGRYCVYGDIIGNLSLGFLLALVAFSAVLMVVHLLFEIDYPTPRIYVASTIIILIFYISGAVVIPLIRCETAPEIYGLMNLIELIKS